MAVELKDFIGSLRREVTPLGTAMPTTGPGAVTDEELTAYLADAFWEARLDGFCTGYACDEDGTVDPVNRDGAVDPGGPDLGREQVALIIIYAGLRILRMQVVNTRSAFRAKAGPVEYEEQNAATMLAEMLKQLQGTKDRLIAQADSDDDLTHVFGFDAFSTRLFDADSYAGSVHLLEP